MSHITFIKIAVMAVISGVIATSLLATNHLSASDPPVPEQLHEILALFGKAAAQNIEEDADLDDFSLRLIRNGVCAREGNAVLCFWLFFRYQKSEGSMLGGGKAEGVIVVEIVPQIQHGSVQIEVKPYIASVRGDQHGLGSLFDGAKKAVRKISEKEGELAVQVQGFEEQLNDWVTPIPGMGALPLNGYIPVDADYITSVCKTLFPLERGVTISDSARYANEGTNADKIAESHLVIGAVFNTDINEITGRRTSDMPNQDGKRHSDRAISKEMDCSGHSIRFFPLKLKHGYKRLEDIKRDTRPGHDGSWHDVIRCVFVIPGGKYSGQVAELYDDIDYKRDSGTVQLEPGFYSLHLEKDHRSNHLHGRVSSLRVVARGTKPPPK